MAVPPVTPAPGVRAVRRGRMLALRRSLEDFAGGSDEAGAGPPAAAPGPGAPAAPVGAQLLGERQRRGLRAGPEVLEQARSTYLQTEYAGPRDRRPRKGQITRTEV